MARTRSATELASGAEYVSSVFYFRSSLSSARSGAMFRDVARSVLENLDPPAAEIAVYRRQPYGMPTDPRWQIIEHGVCKMWRDQVSLENAGSLDMLLDLPHDVEAILAEAPRPGRKPTLLDFAWKIEYDEARPGDLYNQGLDARLHVHVNVSLFKDERDPSMRRLVDELVGSAARWHECYYGHIELASVDETHAGLYYATLKGQSYPWHRKLNDVLWWDRELDRPSTVRGVYWGNYLGPELARRFDPHGDVTSDFACHTLYPNGPAPQYTLRFENGGLFLAIGPNPLEMSRQWNAEVPLSCTMRAAWLYTAFRRSGILL